MIVVAAATAAASQPSIHPTSNNKGQEKTTARLLSQCQQPNRRINRDDTIIEPLLMNSYNIIISYY
jgi:hypothetical protein